MSPRWTYALTALVLLAVGFSAWRPTPAGLWHDDGVYMMVGQSIAEGEGLRYGGVPGAPSAPKFPPLYSAVLGLLWFVLGDLGAVTLAAEVLNLGLLAGAGGLLAFVLHRHAGIPLRAAALAGVLSFASGDVLRHALIPLSESLFVFLALLALALWPEKDDWRALIPPALALSALTLTRSAAVAFIVGFAAAFVWSRRWKAASIVVGVPTVVTAAWGLWSRARAADIPPELADILGPYSGWLTGQVLASPMSFVTGLPAHVAAVVERVVVLAVPRSSGSLLWLAGLLLAPLLITGVRRLTRDFPVLTLSAGAYLLLLVAWPYADRRLAVPLHPLVVACLVVGGRHALDRWKQDRLAAALVVLATLWVGVYSVVGASRIAEGWPGAAYRIRAERLAPALEALGQAAPPDAVVGAPELWAALHLHGGWPTVPSAPFRPAAGAGVPVWGLPDEQIALWRNTGVDHLLLEQGGQIHGEALDSLQARCPGSVQVAASFPPQQIVRLEWERCAP